MYLSHSLTDISEYQFPFLIGWNSVTTILYFIKKEIKMMKTQI